MTERIKLLTGLTLKGEMNPIITETEFGRKLSSLYFADLEKGNVTRGGKSHFCIGGYLLIAQL